MTTAAIGGERRPRPTTTTEQVVVQAADGDFNAGQIYEDVAPGVVTVLSIFGGGGEASILGGGGAGQGSGFVVSEEGEIVTNAHVVTRAASGNGGGQPKEANQVFVEFADRNRVPAEVVGFDADADVALIKVDPDGLDLKPLAALRPRRVRRRRAGRRDRQPLRRASSRSRSGSSRRSTARSSR